MTKYMRVTFRMSIHRLSKAISTSNPPHRITLLDLSQQWQMQYKCLESEPRNHVNFLVHISQFLLLNGTQMHCLVFIHLHFSLRAHSQAPFLIVLCSVTSVTSFFLVEYGTLVHSFLFTFILKIPSVVWHPKD